MSGPPLGKKYAAKGTVYAVRMEHAENLKVEFYITLREILSGLQIAHSNYVIFVMSHGLMLPIGAPIVLGD